MSSPDFHPVLPGDESSRLPQESGTSVTRMRRVVSLGLFGVLLFSACETTPKPTSTSQAKGDDAEYVRYTPTGSHISQRAKKKTVEQASKEEAEQRDLLSDLQALGHHTDNPEGSAVMKPQ